MNIKLSDHFTYRKLIRFTIPSIAMMIFTSIYGIVDGFFVSNFVGKTQFAALNFVMPFIMVLGSTGFMFGTGGSALVAKTLGEKKDKKAQELFSLFVYVPFLINIVIAGIGIAVLPYVASLIGDDPQMIRYAILYGRILLCALPAYTLQIEFQTFFVTAEKPQLGFVMTMISGAANILLDTILVAVLELGLAGAAGATALTQVIGGFVPVIYFLCPNNSLLRLRKTYLDLKALRKAITNGISELLSSISMSTVAMLYNMQLLKYAGQNGVAAYGTIMYIDMIFFSSYIGYSMGTAPVISYHYGARNHRELKNLRKRSLNLMIIVGAIMFVFAEIMARPLAMIFTSYDATLLDMTVHGFRIYSFAFLYIGIVIFGSSFFTALNNGLVSAMISFLRVAVFEVLSVLILPLIWGLDGIWLSINMARLFATVVTVIFLVANRKKYHY